MPVHTLKEITAGKKAVEVYQEAHKALYSNGWYKGIEEAHTPLLDALLVSLTNLGFNSLNEFEVANENMFGEAP